MLAICTVTATLANGTALELTTSKLTLDDSWTPYAQASLVVMPPTNLDLIDPRNAPTITLKYHQHYGPVKAVSGLSAAWGGKLVSALTTAWAGKLVSALSTAYGSGTYVAGEAYRDPVDRVAVLHIRRRRCNTDGSADIDLASAEALLADLRSMQGGTRLYAASTLRELVEDVFDELNVATAHTFTLATGDADTPVAPSPTLSPGQSYTDFFTPYLQAGNLRLWADELGLFHLTMADAILTGALVLSVATNVEASTDEIDRDGDLWADSVVVEYNDPETGTPYISAYPQDGRTISKTRHVRVDALPPFDQFSTPDMVDQAAKNIYDRLQGRGREVPVDAVSDFSTTPGTPVTATLLAGTLTGIVRAVEWRTPENTMTVTTRDIT